MNEGLAITSPNNATFTAGVAGTFDVTTSGFPIPTITRGSPPLPPTVTFTDDADGTGTLAGTPTTGRFLTQITNTTGGSTRNPAISSSGTRIVFQSNRDLAPGSPGNADGNAEIFLYDTTTGAFTQITNTTGGPTTANQNPDISGDGSRIVFRSNRDLTPGSPGNADGNVQIFLYDIGTSTFTQITNSSDEDNVGAAGSPKLNANGTRIVFSSNSDLVPGSPGNADGNQEIFLYDTTTSTLSQITNSTGDSSEANTSPGIDGSGTRIAFRSNRDLIPDTPGNADNNGEIFLYDTTTATLTQVTSSTGFEGTPFDRTVAISAGGARIVFVSTADLTPGSPGNADANGEIFLYDITTGTLTQVTNTSTVSDNSLLPSINAAGTMIAFGSRADLTPGSPGNADNNVEVFVYDVTAGTLTQLTATSGVSAVPAPKISGSGTRVTFEFDLDLTPGAPGNADGNREIFLASAGTGGTYQMKFTASNGVSPDAVQDPFTLTVQQAPAITSANAVTFRQGSPGRFVVGTTGFPAPAVNRGGVALPANVTYTDNGDGTGTLAGMPNIGTLGGYAITFQGTNEAGTTPVQNFTLTIGKASQTITFTSTPSSPVVAGPSYAVTATGGGSGNAVTFTIDASATSVCSISGGNSVSFQTAGTCVINANQAGDANYDPAPQSSSRSRSARARRPSPSPRRRRAARWSVAPTTP